MGCVSCAQKYAALKASRQALKTQTPVDVNAPRNVKPVRRGVIRKADKLQKQSEVLQEENQDAKSDSTD